MESESRQIQKEKVKRVGIGKKESEKVVINEKKERKHEMRKTKMNKIEREV